MTHHPRTLPAQRAHRATVAERYAGLEAEFKSSYARPSEAVELLAPPRGRAENFEADPAMALSAAATIRLLSEWLEKAAALPWTLYNPAHAADAADDLTAALEHLAGTFPLIADSVVRAAGRGDVPERTGVHAATSAQELRASSGDLRSYAESASGQAKRWHASPYRGYLVEGEAAHIRAVAKALVRLESGITVTSVNLEESEEGLRAVVFELAGREFVVVDNLNWELRYPRADGSWGRDELDLPIGIAVHPVGLAQEVLGAIARVLGTAVADATQGSAR